MPYKVFLNAHGKYFTKIKNLHYDKNRGLTLRVFSQVLQIHKSSFDLFNLTLASQ